MDGKFPQILLGETMDWIKQIELKAYSNWIDQNIAPEEAIGNCALWVRVMRQAFPELKIVVGAVKHEWCNSAYHEWLSTNNGEIIDPTRSQFDMLFGRNWMYV